MNHFYNDVFLFLQRVEGVGYLLHDIRGSVVALCASGSFCDDLLLDPSASGLEADSNGDRWCPPQFRFYHSVVTVSSAYTHWARNVLDRKVFALETHGDLRELVHVHHLVSAQVEGHLTV